MLSRQSPVASAPRFSPVPRLMSRTEQTPSGEGLKRSRGLRALPPTGSIAPVDTRPSSSTFGTASHGRQSSRCSEDRGYSKRARTYETTAAIVETMPPREAFRILETFEERHLLGEKCVQLQADVDQRSREVRALQQHTKALMREFAACRRQKRLLEEQVEAMQATTDANVACVVCITEEATHVIVPCGHLALCADCCSGPIRRCPLCRQRCEQKIRLFKP
jgi:hypothetical protein